MARELRADEAVLEAVQELMAVRSGGGSESRLNDLITFVAQQKGQPESFVRTKIVIKCNRLRAGVPLQDI